MDNPIVIYSIVICLIILIVSYCLQSNVPYPKCIIVIFNEPIFRFSTYLAIFMISSWISPIIGLLLLIVTLLLHIDYLDLCKRKYIINANSIQKN